MARFRKKPVEVDAREFTTNGPALAEWCGGRYRPTRDEITAPNGETAQRFSPQHIDIETLEGVMRAEVGDWIIRGVKGEFYPCKPDIFEATYEPTEAA